MKKQEYHDRLKAHLELLAEFPEDQSPEENYKGTGKDYDPYNMEGFMDKLADLYYDYFQHHMDEAWEVVEQYIGVEENVRHLQFFDSYYICEYSKHHDSKLGSLESGYESELRQNIDTFLSKWDIYNEIFTPYIISPHFQGKRGLVGSGLHHCPKALPRLNEIIDYDAGHSEVPDYIPKSHWWWFAESGSEIIDQLNLYKGISEWSQKVLSRVFGPKEKSYIAYLSEIIQNHAIDLESEGKSWDHFSEEPEKWEQLSHLCFATLAGDTVLAQALIENGAVKQLHEEHEFSPMQLAYRFEYSELVELFREFVFLDLKY